jgi:hypothetical protein
VRLSAVRTLKLKVVDERSQKSRAREQFHLAEMVRCRSMVMMMVAVMVGCAWGRDKIFCIGPNKTGTTTLAALFEAMGYTACHINCPGKHKHPNWAAASIAHDASYFEDSDAFSDVGNVADFIWLSSQFPTARFIYNTRPLKSWMLSKMDMHRRTREEHGCTPFGWYELQNKCGGPGIAWASPDAILFFIVELAAQQSIVQFYFDSTPALRNRFATHDFTSHVPAAETRAFVDWIVRPDLGANTTDTLLLLPGMLPTRGTVAEPRRFDVPHANAAPAGAGKHSPDTVQLVSDTLERNGCTKDMHDDVWMLRCADEVMKRNPFLRATYEKLRERYGGRRLQLQTPKHRRDAGRRSPPRP